MSEKVCIIGEGTWGTAIATLLANNGHHVNLWCYNSDNAQSINTDQINKQYFSQLILDKKIRAFTNLQEAIAESKFIFEAIPVKYLRKILQDAKPHYKKHQVWIALSKGIEQDSFLLPTGIIDNVFEHNVNKAVISGPSFAHDLVAQHFTAVDIGSNSDQITKDVIKLMSNDYFKLNSCDDIIGLQIGGAFKNVITIALGIAEGLGFSDNTKACIFTKGLNEISYLTKIFGGKQETIFGLCGVGDLVLSCFGKHSKNLKLGIEIGKGKKISEILSSNNIPEGINTIKSLNQLISQKNLNLPLLKNIYQVIFEDKNFISCLNL